jgi:hypothetical protein
MTAHKVFSFATMMVLAQRRHAARVAAKEVQASAPQQQRSKVVSRPPRDGVSRAFLSLT